MRVVLLSGGSGTRLLPISTECCPKQFLPFFEADKSMLYTTYKNIKKFFPFVYFATQSKYIELINTQIKEDINFIIEPDRIGTFGAVLNIANYFKYVEKLSDEEIISIVPTDHDVDCDFYKILEDAALCIKKRNTDICLIGIRPESPSTKYGYIVHENNILKEFKEKPDERLAQKLINNNSLWNSGIIVFKLKYIIDISKKYIEYGNYEEFLANYNNLPKISFDKEILEKNGNIGIIQSNKKWNDLGTWDSLSKKISTADQYNTNIINFEDKEIRNIGVRDSIIINSSNGLALLNKSKQQIYWEDWGFYKNIINYVDGEKNIKSIILNIYRGNTINYNCIENINKIWFVTEGLGEILCKNKKIEIKAGQIIQFSKEKSYVFKALEDVQILELQYNIKQFENCIINV